MAAMFEDATFWAAVALVLFLALIAWLGVPKTLGAALDRRAAAIDTELKEARRLREEAQALLAEYQRKAREAQKEAEEILEIARREAAAYATEAAQRTDDYVARRARLAEQKIAQAETRAIQEVRSLSVDLAIAAAERVLGGEVKGDTASGLLDRAIGDVRTRLN